MTSGASAADKLVSTNDELAAALENLQAGDTVVLANGEWRDMVIDLKGMGTEHAPITLRAAEAGKAIIKGNSAIFLEGEHLVVDGLHFLNVGLPENSKGLFSFRGSNNKPAYHSRLSNTVFEKCNPEDKAVRYPWVSVYGRENTVTNSRFIGQDHSGVTVQVRIEEENANHVISNNHFMDRPVGGGNGFECIQIGQSQDSMKVGGCIVENNVFEECDGETEIVSIKTCNNIVRNNLFLRSKGSLTLRHGNGSVAENNIFLGEGKEGTGGIRIVGSDHRVKGNYFSGIEGVTGGLVVFYCGIPDSPLNGYFSADRVVLEDNVFMNNFGPAIYLNGGYGKRNRVILPEDVVIRGNVIRQTPGGNGVAVAGTLPSVKFEGNQYDHRTEVGRPDKTGFQSVTIELESRAGGTSAALIQVDKDSEQKTIEPPTALNLKEIGPSWHLQISRLVLWNGDRLNELKNGNSEELNDARKMIIEKADQIVADGKVYSVTFNERTPPSGNIRDYYSTGPYWWPDPEKPDGLPYIRRDGEFNPERDLVSDREPLFTMVKDTRACALAYVATGDEKYAVHAMRVAHAWFLDSETGMRPNLNHAQAIPGRTEGRGTGIIDSHPFAELVDALLILESSPAMSMSDQKELHDWFTEYKEWLTHHPNSHHERDAVNNHGTAFDLQIVALSSYLGNDLAVRDLLENSVAERIISQIDVNGTQPHELSRTRTWSYCTENLEHFFKIGAMGLQRDVNIFEIKDEDGNGLQEALDYVVPYVCTPEEWPHRQDTEWQDEYARNVLSIANGIYGGESYKDAFDCVNKPEYWIMAYLLEPSLIE